MVELSVVRRTDKTWKIYFKVKATKAVIDITGSTLLFTVKTNQTDTDAEAIISKDITSHTDPTNGETKIYLTTTDTDVDVKVYYFDIKYVDSAGEVTYLFGGLFKVLQDITVRTS